MKNSEVLNLYSFLMFQKDGVFPVLDKIREIRSTTVQWWKDRNIEKITKSAKDIYTALEPMKSDEFKEAAKHPESDEFKRLAFEFEQQENVKELLEIESEIAIKKIKIDQLPPDLDGSHMAAISWMLED